MNKFPHVFLHKNEEEEIRRGFPWVYDNEIAGVRYVSGTEWVQSAYEACTAPDGSAVEVFSKSGLFLGTGILNKASKIAVRLLCRERAETLFDSWDTLHTERLSRFIFQRIKDACSLRFLYFKKDDSFRLVFAEADLLPGFIADRYCDESGHIFVVVQFLSLSCEVFRNEILDAIRTVCRPYGIYERSDVSVRLLEGLEKKSGWIDGVSDPVIIIRENGISMTVDMQGGQKTGYFLDQKHNRAVVLSLAKGRRVLDAFAHTGGFGLHAVKGGAKEVVSVDIVEPALDMAERNIALNRAHPVMRTLCKDVFDLLREYESGGERFDMIILDPPAFTKSSKNKDRAYGGYKEINLRAMKLLVSGGILVSCSCSHFFDERRFYHMLENAACDAGRQIQYLEQRGAPPDHPALAGYEQSKYLKCAVMRVS